MSSILRIQNCYSYLQTDNGELNQKLWKSLRFQERNYFHSTAYKRKIWDGYRDFYERKDGRFLTGLLPEVFLGLKLINEPYEVVDERDTPIWQYNSIDANFLDPWTPKGHPKVVLHDYQIDYVNQAIKYGRGLVTSPTSSGKTFVMISIIKCLPPNTPILFLTKNAGLVNQNYNDMKLWGIENLGRYYGKFKEPNRIMCVTVHKDTLKGIAKLLPLFKVLIVDEVHEAMSAIPIKAYNRMKGASIRLGFSATPFKFTKKNAKGEEVCKDKVHKYSVKGYFGAPFKTTTTTSGFLTTKDLQGRDILSKSECTIYPIYTPKTIQHEPYGDAVTLGISNNFEFLLIVKKLALSLTGRTLILVERIDQGEYLSQLIPGSLWIQGKDKLEERTEVFKELKTSEKVVAIAMRHIITAGINVFIHNLINAAGGKAEHSVVQQMGRGLRTAGDKEILSYYDFLFMTNKYLQDHSNNRIEILKNEGHFITLKNEIDF